MGRSWLQGGVVALACLACLACVHSASPHEENLHKIEQERLQRARISSFFRMGENPLAWDDNVLAELSKRPAGPSAKETYVRSGNLAAYFGLHPVRSLHLPVPLNLVFVGFQGEGNLEVKFTEDELRKWFGHLDHVLQHTRVDLNGKGEREGEPPLRSVVHYNFTCHVVGVGHRVAETFSRAIRIYSRPEDPEAKEATRWQVDAAKFDDLVDGFLEELGLHHQYNLVVINPAWDPLRPYYGYRKGFSSHEMKVLARDPKRVLDEIHQTPRPPAAPAKEGKFRWIDMEYESEGWVDKVTHTLDEAEVAAHAADRAAPAAPPGAGPRAGGGAVGARARRMATDVATHGTQDEAAYVHQVLDGSSPGSVFPQVACLTDAFVGRGRYSWLDLTAGPFEWGPVVGGAGVRTNSTVVEVSKHFEPADPEDDKPQALRHEDLEAELEEIASDRFGELADQENSGAMLAAELDVYEMFAQKHCQGRDRRVEMCDDIKERVKELEAELRDLEVESPPEERKHHREREHRWNIFGDEEVVAAATLRRDMFLAELGSTLSSHIRHVVAPSTAAGTFEHNQRISFLLYVIGERSVPLPPRPGAGIGFDVDAFKAEILSLALPSQRFTFHTTRLATADDPALALAYSSALRTSVTPTVRGDGTFAATPRVYLDSSALQQQLLHTVMDKQAEGEGEGAQPDHGGLEVPILVFLVEEDFPVFIDQHYLGRALPDMVLAVQSTHHHAQETHMSCNGDMIKWDLSSPLKSVVAATVQYLSGVLPSHVGTHPSASFRPPPPPPTIHSQGPAPSSHATGLGEEEVENKGGGQHHHLHMHQGEAHAGLSAPSVAQDWMWSVGAHPLSHTSPGHHLSLIQRDAVHRAHVINALDCSAGEVNAAVEALAEEETHADTWWALNALPGGKALAEEHRKVVALWGEMVAASGLLEWDAAVGHLGDLKAQTRKFVQLAEAVAGAMHPERCTLRRRVRLGMVPAMGAMVVVAGGAVACLLLRGPRHNKPKIN